MLLIYIDIILLIVLVTLTMFTFCFCIYQMTRLRRKGKVTIVVDARAPPRRDDGKLQSVTVPVISLPVLNFCPERSTVVTCRSPCRSSPAPSRGSPSAEYEPLGPPPPPPSPPPPLQWAGRCASAPPASPSQYNRVARSWNWNYKEYQI